MFFARVCLHGSRRLATVVEQCGEIAGFEALRDPVGELAHISRCPTAVTPCHLEIAQVVRDAARADDQEAPLGKRCQRPPESPRLLGTTAALDRERYHRHVGVRKHHAQRHPGAVVETAPGILRDRKRCSFDRGDDLVGRLAAAGGWITDPVQLLREPPEVMDRFGALGKADCRHFRIPVRADDDDHARRRQHARRLGDDRAGSTGTQREGRRAVRDEQRRLRRGVLCCGRVGRYHWSCSRIDGRTLALSSWPK